MAITTTSAGHSRAQTILADVPPRCALLDAPMSAACGAFGALDARGVACPMLNIGDRVIILVRPELDFMVHTAATSAGEARPLTYWPSAQMAMWDESGWPGEGPVWVIPPECTKDGLPEVATVLDAITETAADPVQSEADALTWRLASEQFHRHAADAALCSACSIGTQCACVDLAINGLHAALGHPNTEADYWRGLTRIRRSQPASAAAVHKRVLVGP